MRSALLQLQPLCTAHLKRRYSSRHFISSLFSRYSAKVNPPNPAKPAVDTADSSQSVVGTVPYHTAYTLLRHPYQPSTYPAKLDNSFSPLGRRLMVQGTQKGEIVNFYWEDEDPRVQSGDSPASGNKNRFPYITFAASASEGSPSKSSEEGDFLGRRPYYPIGVTIEQGNVSHDDSEIHKDSTTTPQFPPNEAFLFVCTHAARDCRCGDQGNAFVDALREELNKRQHSTNLGKDELDKDQSEFVRGLEAVCEEFIGEGDAQGEKKAREMLDAVWSRIRIGEVGHVGGHKYAANLLAFPFGDWLGNLTPAHAPLVLDAIASRLLLLQMLESRKFDNRAGQSGSDVNGDGKVNVVEALSVPLILDPTIWRGRMGLSKDEQTMLFERYSRNAGDYTATTK
ncbi:uncharacterized protein FOMMEDRAFT_25078 [Fomitiporia mediterranea MF3/22]|uniref:uncharacterized protein n=1 Tax=Fomitiporia mediterranea (strain MF3/22) TaxID=694068 RepID=UPI00044075D1|nr:uncharacterized protein FOMMEDRAFT_25078 [Fomitiporia mediterranea MF3/22]EJD07803.1 hypothetical protein FOMMEDRAFT_25078 [Fomitiporia mediterranea MF3/22]